MLDDTDKQAIRELMENPELSEGVTVHKTLASTNAAAKELILNDNAAHGRVLIAENQTGAYGRRGKSFFTYDGGVYMSIILRPKQAAAETATLITVFAAVAVCNAVFAVSGKQCKIKWVNDIFLNNKKVCGILTEAISGTDAAVLGIGLNLAPFGDGLPAELTDTAGSVFETGEIIPQNAKNRFAADIIETIMSYANVFNGDVSKDVLAEYKARSLLLGREITVMPNSGGEYAAAAIDIDEKGGLIIKKEDGSVETLSSGEVRVKL